MVFSIAMRMLLASSPKIEFTAEEKATYDKLVSQIYDGELIAGEDGFDKLRFLQYLSLMDEFVFHGSNNLEINEFEPRRQTLFNGKVVEAVFASSEPNWSMFYAVFDRSKLVGGFRNGCLVYKGRPYHFYSLNETTMENDPWTPGMMYILPKEKFELADTRRIRFDEWVCRVPVKPLAKMKVDVEDFRYFDKVSTHGVKESVVKTLLFYRMRTRG